MYIKKYSWLFGVGLLLSLLIVGCNGKESFEKYLNLGNKYLMEENYDEAVVAFTKAIEIAPKNADGYIRLAEAYVYLGEYEQAVDVLEQGIGETSEPEKFQEYIQAYKKYLEYPEVFLDLTQALKQFQESNDPIPMWGFMSQEEYQTLVSNLTLILPYIDQEGEILYIYPCGHVYFGTMDRGKRSGWGIWACFDYEEGLADCYQGEWIDDYPDGESNYWLIDIYDYPEQVERGFFVAPGIYERIAGVLHATKEQDEGISMQSKSIPMNTIRSYQETLQKEEEDEPQNESQELEYISDELTDKMRLLASTDNDMNGLEIMFEFSDLDTYLICLEAGEKGADYPYAIIDSRGNVILDGYFTIWRSENGYARCAYYEEGTLKEATRELLWEYNFFYDPGHGPIDVYIELYDWSGTIIERQKLEDLSWLRWMTDEPYPNMNWLYESRWSLLGYDFRDGDYSASEDTIDIAQSEDGFIVRNKSGKELGHIKINNASRLQPIVIGNVLGLWQKGDYGCARYYWIDMEE